MLPGGYGWNYASHDPRPAPLFFPGLRGRAAGGHPGYPPALPRPGKNHPAVGPATLRNNGALCGIEPINVPICE
jgi:hypothetical protein